MLQRAANLQLREVSGMNLLFAFLSLLLHLEHGLSHDGCSCETFTKVGCALVASTKPRFFEFDVNVNGTLETLACMCSEKAKTNGLKYFSLGERNCTGYNATEVSVVSSSQTGCRRIDQSNCNDSNPVSACYGRPGYHYVYELTLAEQLSLEEDIRDCSEYDYIVRHGTATDMYLGPVPGAYSVGTPFSFCLWVKMAYVPGHPFYYLFSYSIQSSSNYFTSFFEPGSAMDSDEVKLAYDFDDQGLKIPLNYPGGIFNKWLHVCGALDLVNTKLVTIYINGELLVTRQSSLLMPLEEGALLVLFHDQDNYGGALGSTQAILGDATLFNVWDYLITADEVKQMYLGPGTERGNAAAWVDLEKYLHGYTALRSNPVLKWKGGGCSFQQADCNEDSGICRSALFQCPYSPSLTAPRSCVSSDVFETKPCSDHDYYLEYPSTYTRARIEMKQNILHHTWYLTVCVWIKFPPGSERYHSVVFIGQPQANTISFHLTLWQDQQSLAIDHKRWTLSETYADDKWFHVCGVKDFQNYRMFKNGVQLGADIHKSDAVVISSHDEIYIGDHPKNNNQYWSFLGSLAHLNIWDKALTGATVASIAGGGRTYVGNILGWPDLLKYAIPGTIDVHKPSPVMKWSDSTCHWSKTTCIPGKICDNAKYVCPPVQLNEVSPHSCGVSSYDMGQNEALRPHLVADLVLVSRDKNLALDLGVQYSSIFVNDLEQKFSGGARMHIVVLNALTGLFIKTFGCSVLLDPACGETLITELNKIRIERIMLMVIYDSPGPYFQAAIPAIRSTFGDELHINSTLKIRQPYSMLGYNGFHDVSWRESKIHPVQEGPSVIKRAVPLLRESCLDHMHMGERKDGKYIIYPRGGKEMTVFCDFSTNGGGWTVIQRRTKGDTVFPTSLTAYENGFGAVDGEFWLGNRKIHRLGVGQMLAIAYENSTSVMYDLYDRFYVHDDSQLNVANRSGTFPEALINAQSELALLFVAPTSSPSDVECTKENDGGWWYLNGTCTGKNLNAKRERCPKQDTEMLLRQRLPSNDIVIKELPLTMTYQEAMDSCINDDLRLCSSMEICRDGENVVGGTVKGYQYVPVADYYNRWIQIASDDEDTMCHIEYNPVWGTNGERKHYKGQVYCCKHFLPVAKAKHKPVRSSKLTMPSSTYTYNMALDACIEIGKKLCTKIEICRDGHPLDGTKHGLDEWTPIADYYNGWIQLGDMYPHLLCDEHRDHYDDPSWGDQTTGGTRGDDVYCCPLGSVVPTKYTVPMTFSYTNGMDMCAEKKQRLCTFKEICPDGPGKDPSHGKFGSDKWVRILDRKNDWVQVGTHGSAQTCSSYFDLFDSLPTWGEGGSVAGSFVTVLFCCPVIYEGRIARTWRYDLKFHGNLSYVRFPKITPLPQCTVCWWMLLNVRHDRFKTVFSYQSLATNEQIIEFAVKSDGSFRLTVGVDERLGEFPSVYVDNHEYHHVCVLWNWLTQEARVFRDGLLISSFAGVQFPGTPAIGSLVIGQSYMNTSKSFEPERSFNGAITRFNIWDNEQEADVIETQSIACGEEEGNVIAWPEVKLWTFDGVEIIEGDHCFPESCLSYLYRKKRSGLYKIRPLKNQSTFEVYCEQETGTGGWINIGERAGGALSFYDKTFTEFKYGFGELTGEFWLGHEKINYITSSETQHSLLSGHGVSDFGIISRFVILYERFILSREEDSYKLRSTTSFGSENRLNIRTNFVTADRDGDANCGSTAGSYWHKTDSSCVNSNLFGIPTQGGLKGAQWFGKDTSKVANWKWMVKSLQGFKSRQPVMFWMDITHSWVSAQEFCHSKGADLCPADVLCNTKNDPFGGVHQGVRRSPCTTYDRWVNLGSGTCKIVKPPKGSTNEYDTYKGRMFCCYGYTKRDWRYDLRFSPGSTGHVRIPRTTFIYRYTICWWLRTRPFTQDIATVFTLLFAENIMMKFSVGKNGELRGTFSSHTSTKTLPSAVDGTWHHYCLTKHVGHGHIDVFYDGLLVFTFSYGDYGHILDGGLLVIGQEVTSSGSVVPGRGLIGDLSRFNFWLASLSPYNIKRMAKKCGGEMGDLVAWSEVKYYIVDDVSYKPETTCIKPESHFWPFKEVDEEGTAYKDVLNDYDLSTKFYTSPIEPGRSLRLSEKNTYLELKESVRDDCLTDPQLCFKTGLTIGLWLKRKGLRSKIVPPSDEHYFTLLGWLNEAASSVSDWLLCYNHTGPDLSATAFHEGCNDVGATLTLVKVGDYVFGGFSNENWGGPSRHIPSHSSFLFSIYNPSSIAPVKLEVIAEQNASALYTDEELGPTFGKNFDLKITSPQSSSSLGETYRRPPGVAASDAGSFFASTPSFAVDQIEVFYAYVPSEAVGIEDPNVIKDEQMTASNYVTNSKYGPQNARLYSDAKWRAVNKDVSAWLQVKLNEVTTIRNVAVQGCGSNAWVKTFKLSFSIDGIYWTSYKENLTEKILTGNSDGGTVKHVPIDPIEAKYVKFTAVDKEGTHVCMRIELYTVVEECPTTSNDAIVCPEATSSVVVFTEDICRSYGCCFVNSNCYSKQKVTRDLGMQSGLIPDESLTASSWSKDYRPLTARFNYGQPGWMSSADDSPQWLQVELNQDETLTHVATQSLFLFNIIEFCKSYTIHYRNASSGDFDVYMENGHPRVFSGYTEEKRAIKHLFLKPFVARFVRLYPQQIPTGYVRIELYRAVKGSRTNIISSSYASDYHARGIFLRQHTLMIYRFSVQTDSAMWEVFWEWITYKWTHLMFTWSEKSGIQFYENGNLKQQSKEPSQFIEAKFTRDSEFFYVGANREIDAPNMFDVANLFVLKRFALPNEATSLAYNVPCSFNDTSQCVWNRNTTWKIIDSPTPSDHTGPEEGARINDFRNLALGNPTSPPSESSLAVDGFLETCTVLNASHPGSLSVPEWAVNMDEPWKIELVVIYSTAEYDPDEHVQFIVKAQSGPSEFALCYEVDDIRLQNDAGRYFYCNQTFDVISVVITSVDPSQPLVLCEVAVYPMASDKFAYMEASYPVKKGFNGILTTSYFSQYNCLQFSYHMHGKNMGRLNVFGPNSKNGNKTLLWRIAGDQGDEWQSGVVKLEHNSLKDFHEVTFEAIVGDGYQSDIALHNVVFTVDNHCSTYPPAAVPTISVTSPQRDCSCLGFTGTGLESYLTIIGCTALSQGLEWRADGVLLLQGKCLRPATLEIVDGAKLTLSTSCTPNEVAFRMTSIGAIQHVKSSLCVQTSDWWTGAQLVLGRQGCYDVKWSWMTVLLKGAPSYSKLNVLKLGSGEISCGEYVGSVIRFTPIDIETTLPGALVVSYNAISAGYCSATVVKLHEENSSAILSFSDTESASVSLENTTKTAHQPLRGSSILGTLATPTRMLSEWLAVLGIFSEFWKPCVYLTHEGTSTFNCSQEEDVPTLLIIRKERVLIGGFMDRRSSNPSGNFLFSLKDSSSSKFNETSDNGGTSAVLTETGLSFAGDELAITWNGPPEVKNVLGNVFAITDLDSMVGVDEFTADDFEVLQPTDEICIPRCKSNEVCDQITGKCICDSTNRPPSWCLTGAASDTIFADAQFYWSMDSTVNVIDEKAENSGWSLIDGDLHPTNGVNGPGIEMKEGDGKIELLTDEKCFQKSNSCHNKGLTVSFWFKSLETDGCSIEDRLFLQTSYDTQSLTGFFMHQESSSGEIVLTSKATRKLCVNRFYVAPNLWTFLTIVRHSYSWTIFLNGMVTNSNRVCSSLDSLNNPHGKLILTNGGSDCSVMFDDVAVWYRALDEHEVQTMYRYYYKDPPMLTASLEVKFTAFVWEDELDDKETSISWKSLEDTVYTKFGSLFPGHENTSFVIDQCRNNSEGIPECNMRLALNGSDYETVEILEDDVPDLEITNLKTDRVPWNATDLTGTSPGPSNITLEWTVNFTNLHQGFIVIYTNNKTNETLNVTVNEALSSYELKGLTGYCYYIINFAFYTLAGVGKWTEIVVETEEDVPTYPPSNLTGHNASSTELYLSWNSIPIEDTYKELRGYVVYVTETDTSTFVKNITTDASTLELYIDDLRKFKTYTVYIRALTVDVGVQSVTLNMTTSEDAPDAPPNHIQVFNSSSRSLRIEFEPVPPDLINGILRGYRVFYWKTREGNDTRRNFTITKELGSNSVVHRRRRRSVEQFHEGYPLFADIYNLEEYTNYTVQIQAITILDGVLAPPFTTLTAEDLPSMAPPNVTARNSSSTSILLEWDLIPEEDWNGIILGYVVYYTGRDGVEQTFVHESTATSLDLQGLEKFTEHSFQLTVFNSIGESNRSEIVFCKTDQDRPDLPPQDIEGIPTSPSTMGIVWKPVPFPFGRGIILGYRFVLSTMSGEILVDKILGLDKDFISVGDLELFTNYTLNMTAFTIKGEGPWASKVVLSLQIAPTIPPMNLTADSLNSLNTLPVRWMKVPPELTKGYIIGYKLYIKLISVGLEEVSDAREREIILEGQPSSYVFENLEFFSMFQIYLVAYTVGGDSPRSNSIYAETCRCGPTLSTQWTNLAPYTNIINPEFKDKKTIKNHWGIFPYIVEDAVVFCCKTCKEHNYTTASFTRNYHGQPSEVFGNEALIKSIDGLTDLTFPVYGYVGMTQYHSLYQYTPLIESPGSAFLVRKEKSSIGEILISNVMGNWPLAVMMVCLAFAAGSIMWWLEMSVNSEEFPPSALKGVLNGFWWAYVTMTTVGYGDRSPRTKLGRVFAIAWTLTGLVVTGIMVGNLASSLTLSVTHVEKIIYGTKVGAIDLSPDFQLGLRLNAKMNTVRSYKTLDELYGALLSGEVDGILLDGYVVGSRKDLFKNPNLIVKKVKDYRSAYGIVWAGRSSRLRKCIDWYMKSRKSQMFSHIAENLEMAKTIDKINVEEELANIFDPTTTLYKKTLFLSLCVLAAAVVLGLIYELIRRVRRATKVKPLGENEMKTENVKTLDQCVLKTASDICHRAQMMKKRHIEQLRTFRQRSWFKKSKVGPSNVTESIEISEDSI